MSVTIPTIDQFFSIPKFSLMFHLLFLIHFQSNLIVLLTKLKSHFNPFEIQFKSFLLHIKSIFQLNIFRQNFDVRRRLVPMPIRSVQLDFRFSNRFPVESDAAYSAKTHPLQQRERHRNCHRDVQGNLPRLFS